MSTRYDCRSGVGEDLEGGADQLAVQWGEVPEWLVREQTYWRPGNGQRYLRPPTLPGRE